MQVAGHQLGLEAVKAAEVVDGVLERAPRLGRVQIADVLAEEHLAAHGDRDRVLQVPAHRQDRRQSRSTRTGSGA